MAQWFRLAVGGLGWAPAAFWRATIPEIMMAVEGRNDANRIDAPPATSEDLEALMAVYGD